MQSTKKGFWDNFTFREDRLIVDGFIVSLLFGVLLATLVSLSLSASPLRQHTYLDWIFWPVLALPVLVFFVAFVLRTWMKRRRTWFPVHGS
ncbi:MAG TPA: hypothetical protein VEY12_11670 [Thermoplasmata archaeon]|nr:hypothetical protein [Thermoplasmata archaeon]